MPFVVPPHLRADTPPVAAQPVEPAPVPSVGKLTPLRDAQGRLLPGHTANPNGRPINNDARPEKTYGVRARELMDKYTIGDIKKLIQSGKLEKMNPWDAMIIQHIAAAFFRGGTALRQLLERMEGRPARQNDDGDDGAELHQNTTVVIRYETGTGERT